MCYFVSSPREREKRDSRRDEREGQGRKRNRNESEETEGIKNISLRATRLSAERSVRYTTFAPPDHPNKNVHEDGLFVENYLSGAPEQSLTLKTTNAMTSLLICAVQSEQTYGFSHIC